MRKSLLLFLFTVMLMSVLAACGTGDEGAVERESYNYNQVEYGPEQREQVELEREQNRFSPNIPFEGTDPGLPMENHNNDAPNSDRFEADGNNTGTNKQRVDEVTGAFQEQVVQLTNQARKKNGLKPLKINSELSKVAKKKSTDMAKNNYFAHISPTYGSPIQMLKQFGIEFNYAAENIAVGQKTPDEVVQDWLDSPGHRKNIMNEQVTQIGVGYTEEGQHWTQLFISK
ncbi:CAP domain-containing protein [Halobacillus hunanensis]|uniref:CAP domain-containing protein n=1 Tax=Halobacillus hunanensis TaxID=578214 RepID=UPI0009A7E7A5|nr:CAP domain-containing protein [Halobacillus hunanensis]